MNNLVQVVLLAVMVLAAEGRFLEPSWVEEYNGDPSAVSVEESFPPTYLLAGEAPEPTKPEDGEVEVPHELSKRSTTVFRPLFATRERDAERMEQRERRREYWANEQRRRSAPARSPQPYPQPYPGQYRLYPAGYQG